MEYQIKNWNAVIPDCANLPFPMIYVKTDSPLLDIGKKSNNIVDLEIKGTKSLYDNKFAGTLENGLYFPNFRPNFSKKNGYTAIIVLSAWHGYPPNNGSITISPTTGLADALKVYNPSGSLESADDKYPTTFAPVPFLKWTSGGSQGVIGGFNEDYSLSDYSGLSIRRRYPDSLNNNQSFTLLLLILIIFAFFLYINKNGTQCNMSI
jgi:hypothetical protein